MAIGIVLGMTESGKSHHVRERVRKTRKKVIQFDFAHCFTDGVIIYNPTNEDYKRIYTQYSRRDSYSIIVRFKGISDYKDAFERFVVFCKAMGSAVGAYENQKQGDDRIMAIIDEVDFVCTANFQSPWMKWLVNVGRHFSLDTIVIARTPQRIHTDLRANASMITSFNLNVNTSLKYLADNMGAEPAEKIRTLPRYNFVVWKSNGEWSHFNEKGEKVA